MSSIYYEITIKEGFLTCGTGRQISNYIETLGYIPGSTLRGAFISILLNNKKLSFKDHYELFMGSNVIFCNAYPLKNKYKCFPIPFSYFTCKDNPGIVTEEKNIGHPLYNYAVEAINECPLCNAELKQKIGFIYEIEDTYYSYNESKAILPGNKIDDFSQSAGTGDGEFFFSEANISGEEFKFYSFIHFFNDKYLKAFDDLFSDLLCGEQDILLGKRKTATASFLKLDNIDETNCFCTNEDLNEDTLQELYIYCFSDMILVDQFLNYLPNISEDAIKRFCKKLSLNNLDIIFDRPTYVKNNIVAGFNNALGFPLIIDKVIEKGSVIKLIVEGPSDSITLFKQYLSQYGMGLRRNEGFGRVIINPPFLTKGVYNNEN